MKHLRVVAVLVAFAIASPFAPAQEKTVPSKSPIIWRLDNDVVFHKPFFLSPDGKTLAYQETVFRDDRDDVVFYDLQKKKEIRRLQGLYPVAPVLSPDGKTLVVNTLLKGVRLLDWKTGEMLGSFDERGPSDFQLTPDGKFLVGTRLRPELPGGPPQRVQIHVYEVATGKLMRYFGQQHESSGSPFSLSDDGKILVVSHSKGLGGGPKEGSRYRISIVAWELATGKEIGLVKEPKVIVVQRETSGEHERATMWRSDGLYGPNCRVRVSPAGKIMIFPSWPRGVLLEASHVSHFTLALADIRTGEVVDQFTLFQEGGGLYSFALSKDQRTLAASGGFEMGQRKMALVVWDVSKVFENVAAKKMNLAAKQMESLWQDFGAKDPILAYRAMRQLAAAPEQSIPFLEKKLDQSLGRFTGDPDDAPTRQILWGIEVLEQVGTAPARGVLSHLAKSASNEWVASEARISLKRTEK